MRGSHRERGSVVGWGVGRDPNRGVLRADDYVEAQVSRVQGISIEAERALFAAKARIAALEAENAGLAREVRAWREFHDAPNVSAKERRDNARAANEAQGWPSGGQT